MIKPNILYLFSFDDTIRSNSITMSFQYKCTNSSSFTCSWRRFFLTKKGFAHLNCRHGETNQVLKVTKLHIYKIWPKEKKKNTIDSFILILLEAFALVSYCVCFFWISNERDLLAMDWDSKEFSWNSIELEPKGKEGSRWLVPIP